MVTTDWHWRPGTAIPRTALVVAGRTEYTPEGWRLMETLVDPVLNRMMDDPNVLGAATMFQPEYHTIWNVTAWESYAALEMFVIRQISWLKDLAEYVMPEINLRHNAYRVLPTEELPLDWYEVEMLVEKVRAASPLGADAFPELSRMLGLKDL
jgi:hypothetical protein